MRVGSTSVKDLKPPPPPPPPKKKKNYRQSEIQQESNKNIDKLETETKNHLMNTSGGNKI